MKICNTMDNIQYYFQKSVILINCKKFEDERGFFSETYNKKYFETLGIKDNFVQTNFSFSKIKGIVRGLHFQNPPDAQAKLVSVINGSINDVIVDIRKNSPTYGKYNSFLLSSSNMKQLYIPEGFAHGFIVLESNTKVQYKTSNYYAPKNEQTIIWNDKTISIDWKIDNKNVILSKKDKEGISFNDLQSPF